VATYGTRAVKPRRRRGRLAVGRRYFAAVPDLPTIHAARLAELPAATLYGILRLRSAVFVVEQNCVYADMDGRDLEPSTLHLWIDDDTGSVAAALRVLDDGDERSIGRVATRVDQRNLGLASLLMRRAIDLTEPPIWLKAQEYLRDWYATFGFAVCGESWIEDGIPHVPMRLTTKRPQAGGDTGR